MNIFLHYIYRIGGPLDRSDRVHHVRGCTPLHSSAAPGNGGGPLRVGGGGGGGRHGVIMMNYEALMSGGSVLNSEYLLLHLVPVNIFWHDPAAAESIFRGGGGKSDFQLISFHTTPYLYGL